jgi:hypothetical protein
LSSKKFDPSKITVEDIFRAKKERRQRLANLPFEEKIEIVKKLQTVARTIRASIDEDRGKRAKNEAKRYEGR